MIEIQDTPSHCVHENRTEDHRGSWKEEEEASFRTDSLVFLLLTDFKEDYEEREERESA